MGAIKELSDPRKTTEHVLPDAVVFGIAVISGLYSTVGYVVVQAYAGREVTPLSLGAILLLVSAVALAAQTIAAVRRATHPLLALIVAVVVMVVTAVSLSDRALAHTPSYIVAVVSYCAHTKLSRQILPIIGAMLVDATSQFGLLTGPQAESNGLNATAASILPNVLLTYAIYVVIGRVAAGYRMCLLRLQSNFTELETRHQRQTQAAITAERRRMSRELHDVTAHHLAAIAIQSKAAMHQYERRPEEVPELLKSIANDATKSLSSLRQIVGILRLEGELVTVPQPMLNELEELIEDFRHHIPTVKLEKSGPLDDLSDVVQLACYRIVEESLSNAMKHAPGSEVVIRVSYEAGSVAFDITNGFATRSSEYLGQGFGLIGMRERVALLGGKIESGVTGDGGWRVCGHICEGDQKV